jgi:hypothetical protein
MQDQKIYDDILAPYQCEPCDIDFWSYNKFVDHLMEVHGLTKEQIDEAIKNEY